MKAFKDANDGYYQYDGEGVPDWAKGMTPTDVVVVVPVPPRITVVTMRQARLALLGAGLLGTVNGMIAGMTGAQGDAARIEWEFSSEVQRDRGIVLSLGAALGLSNAQLDALFTTASAIA